MYLTNLLFIFVEMPQWKAIKRTFAAHIPYKREDDCLVLNGRYCLWTPRGKRSCISEFMTNLLNFPDEGAKAPVYFGSKCPKYKFHYIQNPKLRWENCQVKYDHAR